MSETQKLHHKAKVMFILELLIFFGIFLIYFWLRSVIVGLYYLIFILSLVIWIIAIVLTLAIYNNTREKNNVD
ncbi:MAG: hypothetical protein GF311_26250 [Candidatus Lokiarchaeota archaeon]|nr:hypothetical protein [Candidatus Lokiarchaeota archaeon]